MENIFHMTMSKQFHIVAPTREENSKTKKIRTTFLKRRFSKTYTNVIPKVLFITSKAECEAASLAIKHVTSQVFITSKAEREAASLAIKHIKFKVKCESRLKVNDDNETRYAPVPYQ